MDKPMDVLAEFPVRKENGKSRCFAELSAAMESGWAMCTRRKRALWARGMCCLATRRKQITW